MRLVLTEEQEALRAAVRDLLDDHSRVRDHLGAVDGDRWRRLAALDVLGLVVPEEYGGAGAGHVERAVVAEEIGRSLAPVPFLGSAVLATDALLALDDEAARRELLPALVSGERTAGVAVAEPGSPWGPGATRATRDGDTWTLHGRKIPVLPADVYLVVATTPDGPGWFRVDSATAPTATAPTATAPTATAPTATAPTTLTTTTLTTTTLTTTTLTTLDPTRGLVALTFDGTPAVRLESADPVAALARVADLATVALAAEQLGGLGRVLEMATEYAKVRMQFGRVIGSYQAVKHGLADVHSEWEMALSVVRYAAWAADEEPGELPVASALAAALLGPAYFRAATACVQYHGGIGYTWEHDAHLYYKRAKSTELLFGSPARDRARLADRLGI
ncbi:acyl-CoA dehydrogenase family protein [Pseudonocardia ailaonensis]|uniref:Acyl-CoA dehydrogenase family protein n=1 Tax=Pseudonocardia ailaonensis TaxID=367279 RepID=A0ABN2NPP4_9PSEU